jgi:hypothetical protein
MRSRPTVQMISSKPLDGHTHGSKSERTRSCDTIPRLREMRQDIPQKGTGKPLQRLPLLKPNWRGGWGLRLF